MRIGGLTLARAGLLGLGLLAAVAVAGRLGVRSGMSSPGPAEGAALGVAALAAFAAVEDRASVAAAVPGGQLPSVPFDYRGAQAAGWTFVPAGDGMRPRFGRAQIAARAGRLAEYRRATAVGYRFLLLTRAGGVYPLDVIRSDPQLELQLRRSGGVAGLPVWVVSLDGPRLLAAGQTAGHHEDNLVYDANTGQLLASFSLR